VAKTNADGLVQLLVSPVTGVAGPSLPRTYTYVDPTAEAPTATGVRPATLAHQLEDSNNIAPWADPAPVNVIGYGTPSGSTARYLYGTVMDCRGSRLFAGAGLRLEWPHSTPKFYWDGDTNEATYDQTHLSGVFSTIIGWANDPRAQTADVPAGPQRVEFVDAVSGDVPRDLRADTSRRG
jgi:hypothetical protein